MAEDVTVLGLEFLEDAERTCSRRMTAAEERTLYHRVEQYVKRKWDGTDHVVGPIAIDGWHIRVFVKRLPDVDGRKYVSYTAYCSDADAVGTIYDPELPPRA